MANNNYTLTDGIQPTGAGTVITDQSSEWGIDSAFNTYIIQSEDLNSELVTDQTPDQKNRVVSELDYDKHWTVSLQVIGAGAYDKKPGDVISYRPAIGTEFPTAVNWKIRSITYNGSYNDKKKYTIELERWSNFPSAT